MGINLSTQRIMVTGWAGFLGHHVVNRLQQRGCQRIVIPRRTEYELTIQRDVERLFIDCPADVVIHLAGCVGGIEFNLTCPGEIYYRNVMMNTFVMEQARCSGVKKFIGIGSVCAYPENTPVPFQESYLWNGYPEPSNAAYGLSKKMMLAQSQAYRAQYGFNAIHLMLINLYGPGDNFDPKSSHVIPALIQRFVKAVTHGESEVRVWGDGSATREFLYVEDAARGIVMAAECYDGAAPVNLGTGAEISIRELAYLIVELTGFKGGVTFDASKPSGQRRRLLDVSRSWQLFGFRSEVDFREGLKRTIEWYRQELSKQELLRGRV